MGIAAAVFSFVAACASEGGAPPVTTPAPDRPSGTAAATPAQTPRIDPGTGSPGDASLADVAVTAETVVAADQPLVLTVPRGDDRRFVALRDGRIVILGADGQLLPDPFLDIRDLTRTDGERGLLGLAFHPDYATNGRFFIHYSGAEDGDTRLAEYRVSDDDADRADPGSARLLLTVEQPAANHNGGSVEFGPDGMLWLALGDGGASGDRFGNGQDPSTLLGALLRIDADDASGDRAYAIPSDNPFADGGKGAPEVWAYGLRNPYRIAFDAGRVFIADVGQNAVEEINVRPADEPGLNYGWPILEGTSCYRASSCDREGLVEPALEYRHEGDVCGVIGGPVYRGNALPGLRGAYVYGDLCAGWVRAFDPASGDDVALTTGSAGLLSFGRDADGEVYVLRGDRIERLVPG